MVWFSCFWTLYRKWRTKECGTGAVNAGSPGPAAYSSTNADVYKYHAPGKTFGIPVRPTDQGTKTPHAYLIVSANGCVERCKPKKFTFGVKRPYKHPPYVVPADNCPIWLMALCVILYLHPFPPKIKIPGLPQAYNIILQIAGR